MVSRSHRDPLASQVTAERGNASRGKLCGAECLQHGHPCSEVGAAARATVAEDDGFITGSAQWGRDCPFGQPGGGHDPNRSSNLCDGVAAGVLGNRSIDESFEAQATRAARAAWPFGQPDGEVALLFRCTAPLCGFAVWETGPWSKAGSAGAPCSEVGVFASGNRDERDGFMVRATRAWGRFRRSGNRSMRSASEYGRPAQ